MKGKKYTDYFPTVMLLCSLVWLLTSPAVIAFVRTITTNAKSAGSQAAAEEIAKYKRG